MTSGINKQKCLLSIFCQLKELFFYNVEDQIYAGNWHVFYISYVLVDNPKPACDLGSVH